MGLVGWFWYWNVLCVLIANGDLGRWLGVFLVAAVPVPVRAGVFRGVVTLQQSGH